MSAAPSPTSVASKSSRIVPWFTAACLLASLTVLGLTAARIVHTHQTPGPFDPDSQGFCDFQNGVYFPSQAFLNRLSPYSQQYAANYPVPRSTPFYSPFTFALHVPFALSSLSLAEPIYFVWMILLAGGIAALTTRWICKSDELALLRSVSSRWAIFASTLLLLVISRGGQQTLYTGYFTFEIILATLISVQYATSRPWLSGLCLAIVACKPNYVLPLGFLMLARGNYKSLSIGAAISIITAVVCAAWIMPEGGMGELLQQIDQTQQIHKADPIERPVNSWIRLDWPAILSKWMEWDPNEWQYLAAMLVMVVPSAIALRAYYRRNPQDQGGVLGLGGAVILITTLVSVYHHAYDAPLMIPVAMQFGLMLVHSSASSQVVRSANSSFSITQRVVLLALICLPLVNYASSQAFLQRFQVVGVGFQLATSLNGLALLIAWFVLMAILIRQSPREDEL